MNAALQYRITNWTEAIDIMDGRKVQGIRNCKSVINVTIIALRIIITSLYYYLNYLLKLLPFKSPKVYIIFYINLKPIYINNLHFRLMKKISKFNFK